MTENDIALKLNDHDHEISSLKHRMKETEARQEDMTALVRNVDKLATNMENMLKVQQQQGTEIDKLKQSPAEDYHYFRRLIIGCVVTGVIGLLVGGVMSMLFNA